MRSHTRYLFVKSERVYIYTCGFTHRHEYRVGEDFQKIYKAGGAAQHGAVVVDSVDVLIQQQERERKESEKRKQTSSLRLPVSVKQRIQEAESRKRPQDEGQESVAKLVRFDPELPAKEPSPKHQEQKCIVLHLHGNLSSSPSSGSGNARQPPHCNPRAFWRLAL